MLSLPKRGLWLASFPKCGYKNEYSSVAVKMYHNSTTATIQSRPVRLYRVFEVAGINNLFDLV